MKNKNPNLKEIINSLVKINQKKISQFNNQFKENMLKLVLLKILKKLY